MLSNDLFSSEYVNALKNDNDMSIIPVSVIDIYSQGVRENENHASTSSRASYSPFPQEVVNLCYELYLRDCKNIFDPFAGWGERHAGALRYGKSYTGYDISEQAIALACEKHGVINTLADSQLISPPTFDGLITCPPYWNLELYEHAKGIDKIKTWDGFISRLRGIFEMAFSAAESGSVFCIMSGDWRKDHKYYDLTYRIDEIFAGFGASVIDKVCISRKRISKIKIMLPQAKKFGYTVRVHESLHVYKKS